MCATVGTDRRLSIPGSNISFAQTARTRLVSGQNYCSTFAVIHALLLDQLHLSKSLSPEFKYKLEKQKSNCSTQCYRIVSFMKQQQHKVPNLLLFKRLSSFNIPVPFPSKPTYTPRSRTASVRSRNRTQKDCKELCKLSRTARHFESSLEMLSRNDQSFLMAGGARVSTVLALTIRRIVRYRSPQLYRSRDLCQVYRRTREFLFDRDNVDVAVPLFPAL